MGTTEFTTFGDAAQRIGALHHQLDRLARRGGFPFSWAGPVRLVRLADLPLVKQACEEAGFIKNKKQLAVA